MEDDWWPDLLAHIPREQPWDEPHVVVARIQPFNDPFFPGARLSRTALVPAASLVDIEPRLRGFGWQVESTGPRPRARPPGTYEPRFWIQGVDLPQDRYEALVLSWESGNVTTLQVDPGFLMTYGLAPRHLEDRELRYDDPATPSYDVVRGMTVSRYDEVPEPAVVTIERDYLQDYLSLRGMALVEVYHEVRRGHRDDRLEAALEPGQEARTIEFADREIQIQRRQGGGYVAQVWGARVIARPGGLPVSEDPLEAEGLTWPGIEGPVDNARARGFRPIDTVFVRDAVLEAYEGKPGFDVFPESGSIHFGAQWGVSWCRRVGRDLIQLEIKKIYESAHPRAIRHWNSYAVAPPVEAERAALAESPNIGKRARVVVEAVAGLGDALAGTAAGFRLANAGPEIFTRVDRVALRGNDWWREPRNAAIARYVPLDLSESGFLSRCVALAVVVIEGLGEGPLRRLAGAVGAPNDDRLKSMQLLNGVVSLAGVAVDAGLGFADGGLAARLEELGEPPRPLDHLFALNDLRQLGAHRAEDQPARLRAALTRFGVRPEAIVGGFGLALDAVYDQVVADLRSATLAIRQASGV